VPTPVDGPELRCPVRSQVGRRCFPRPVADALPSGHSSERTHGRVWGGPSGQAHVAAGSWFMGSAAGHPRRPVALPNSAGRTLVGYWPACVPGASVSGVCRPVWQDSGLTASRLSLVMVTTATVSRSWSPGTRLGATGSGGNSRSVATVTVSSSYGGTGYRRTGMSTP
jgi:hypothetical protein